ncbi:MAG: hypothetical protein LBE59_02110 [Nevskiaceae bacterium]|jgi:hypothetical protein|nr:hypothetical protein [Nevskiaceae bacterium]
MESHPFAIVVTSDQLKVIGLVALLVWFSPIFLAICHLWIEQAGEAIRQFRPYPTNCPEFRGRRKVALLVICTTAATFGAAIGSEHGGPILSALIGAAAFFVVAAVAVHCYIWLMMSAGLMQGPAPRTRWGGAILAGLGVCALTVAVGVISRQFL